MLTPTNWNAESSTWMSSHKEYGDIFVFFVFLPVLYTEVRDHYWASIVLALAGICFPL